MSGDFSGVELHTLAQVCKWRLGRSSLGDSLNAGIDPHLKVAASLMGVTYDEAVMRYEAGEPEAVTARQNSKPANFGYGGGMGHLAFSLAQLNNGVFWEPEDAKILRSAWFDAWEEMRDYHQSCKDELGPGGEAQVECYFSGRLRKVRGFATLANNYFQALTADGAKLALCEVVRQCFAAPKSGLYGCRPCNFVHDEAILEVPADLTLANRAAAAFKHAMETEFNRVCPDYPTTVDVVLSKFWSKRAKTVKNESGLIIPWPSY
jgi:DNA polymerase I-like protein with 3'-5' exonuclease and polymerase domains